MANKKNEPLENQTEALIQEWQKGKEWVDGHIRDFKRLDMLANAQYDGPNDKNPNIGDTTTAGIVRDIMRKSVKRIPESSTAINGSESTVESLTCGFLVRDKILDPTTFGKGFVNTLHLLGRGALSRGFNILQVTATKKYGQFGIVPKLIHYNDFVIEPGVQDASDSGYYQIRTKFTLGKLKRILEREKEKGSASTWNIKALEALIACGPDSNGAADYAEWLTPAELNKQDRGAETFDIFTRYPLGIKGDIVTYSPAIIQNLRTVKSNSKFGFPRILFLVIDPAELSPFGDSRVRLASPNQNFLMILRQSVGSTWLYNSRPAMVQRGLFSGAVTLKSGAKMTSTDPQADIKLLTLDTSTAQQYSTISKGIVESIQDMMGVSSNSSLGALGESKTGVGAREQKLNIDDATKQVTNIIEEFLCQYLISGLDLFLSEQEGEGEIYVDDRTREDILRINPEAFPDAKNPNCLKVKWNELYEYVQKINIKVDTSMSKEDWSDEKRGDIQDALVTVSQNSDPNDPRAMAKKDILEDKLLDEAAPELSTVLSSLPPTPVIADPNLTPVM